MWATLLDEVIEVQRKDPKLHAKSDLLSTTTESATRQWQKYMGPQRNRVVIAVTGKYTVLRAK